MQEQTMPTVAKPMTAFLEALHRLERANADVLDQERQLRAARGQFDQRTAELKTAYQAAFSRAQELGEASTFPDEFAALGLLITFDEEGCVDVQPRAIAETYELLSWAKKAGEEQ